MTEIRRRSPKEGKSSIEGANVMQKEVTSQDVTSHDKGKSKDVVREKSENSGEKSKKIGDKSEKPGERSEKSETIPIEPREVKNVNEDAKTETLSKEEVERVLRAQLEESKRREKEMRAREEKMHRRIKELELKVEKNKQRGGSSRDRERSIKRGGPTTNSTLCPPSTSSHVADTTTRSKSNQNKDSLKGARTSKSQCTATNKGRKRQNPEDATSVSNAKRRKDDIKDKTGDIKDDIKQSGRDKSDRDRKATGSERRDERKGDPRSDRQNAKGAVETERQNSKEAAEGNVQEFGVICNTSTILEEIQGTMRSHGTPFLSPVNSENSVQITDQVITKAVSQAVLGRHESSNKASKVTMETTMLLPGLNDDEEFHDSRSCYDANISNVASSCHDANSCLDGHDANSCHDGHDGMQSDDSPAISRDDNSCSERVPLDNSCSNKVAPTGGDSESRGRIQPAKEDFTHLVIEVLKEHNNMTCFDPYLNTVLPRHVPSKHDGKRVESNHRFPSGITIEQQAEINQRAAERRRAAFEELQRRRANLKRAILEKVAERGRQIVTRSQGSAEDQKTEVGQRNDVKRENAVEADNDTAQVAVTNAAQAANNTANEQTRPDGNISQNADLERDASRTDHKSERMERENNSAEGGSVPACAAYCLEHDEHEKNKEDGKKQDERDGNHREEGHDEQRHDNKEEKHDDRTDDRQQTDARAERDKRKLVLNEQHIYTNDNNNGAPRRENSPSCSAISRPICDTWNKLEKKDNARNPAPSRAGIISLKAQEVANSRRPQERRQDNQERRQDTQQHRHDRQDAHHQENWQGLDHRRQDNRQPDRRASPRPDRRRPEATAKIIYVDTATMQTLSEDLLRQNMLVTAPANVYETPRGRGTTWRDTRLPSPGGARLASPGRGGRQPRGRPRGLPVRDDHGNRYLLASPQVPRHTSRIPRFNDVPIQPDLRIGNARTDNHHYSRGPIHGDHRSQQHANQHESRRYAYDSSADENYRYDPNNRYANGTGNRCVNAGPRDGPRTSAGRKRPHELLDEANLREDNGRQRSGRESKMWYEVPGGNRLKTSPGVKKSIPIIVDDDNSVSHRRNASKNVSNLADERRNASRNASNQAARRENNCGRPQNNAGLHNHDGDPSDRQNYNVDRGSQNPRADIRRPDENARRDMYDRQDGIFDPRLTDKRSPRPDENRNVREDGDRNQRMDRCQPLRGKNRQERAENRLGDRVSNRESNNLRDPRQHDRENHRPVDSRGLCYQGDRHPSPSRSREQNRSTVSRGSPRVKRVVLRPRDEAQGRDEDHDRDESRRERSPRKADLQRRENEQGPREYPRRDPLPRKPDLSPRRSEPLRDYQGAVRDERRQDNRGQDIRGNRHKRNDRHEGKTSHRNDEDNRIDRDNRDCGDERKCEQRDHRGDRRGDLNRDERHAQQDDRLGENTDKKASSSSSSDAISSSARSNSSSSLSRNSRSGRQDRTARSNRESGHRRGKSTNTSSSASPKRGKSDFKSPRKSSRNQQRGRPGQTATIVGCRIVEVVGPNKPGTVSIKTSGGTLSAGTDRCIKRFTQFAEALHTNVERAFMEKFWGRPELHEKFSRFLEQNNPEKKKQDHRSNPFLHPLLGRFHQSRKLKCNRKDHLSMESSFNQENRITTLITVIIVLIIDGIIITPTKSECWAIINNERLVKSTLDGWSVPCQPTRAAIAQGIVI